MKIINKFEKCLHEENRAGICEKIQMICFAICAVTLANEGGKTFEKG